MISKGENEAPLYGLVLAGGKSTRMGRDKAALKYADQPQAQICFDLLSTFCKEVFLSNRADQADAPGHKGFPQIHDAFPDMGPMGGILSALQSHPDAPWLIVACDLPFLDAKTLHHLIEHRNPGKIATAYSSANDGLPEPLCAIYEPGSLPALLKIVDRGVTCPRKALIQSEIEKLELPNPRALDNVNRPEELEAAQQALGVVHNGTQRIHVQYYAILRETVGQSSESVDTHAVTASELYEELQKRHGLRWPMARFRVAVNDQLCDWKTPLKTDDTVSIIPPVAGG